MAATFKGSLIVTALLAGCTSASPYSPKAEQSDPKDEPPEGEDGEDTPSDDPQNVTGAFLVACGTSRTAPKDMPQDNSVKPIGCAVVEKQAKTKVKGQAQISQVQFSLADGSSATPALEAVGDESSPWHVITFLPNAQAWSIKGVLGGVMYGGSAFQTTRNDGKELYIPEGPLPMPPGLEKKNEPPELGAEIELGLTLALALPADAKATNAIDRDDNSQWKVGFAPVDTLTKSTSRLVLSLGGSYAVTRVKYRPCLEGMTIDISSGVGFDVGNAYLLDMVENLGPAPNENSTYQEVSFVDLTKKTHVAFALTGMATCLDEVRVYGKE